MQFDAKLDKYLRALSSFRDDVRKLSIEGASSKNMLVLCDRFRDQDLVNLGIQLDDGQGAGVCTIGMLFFADPILRWRSSVQALAADKAAKKSGNAAAVEAKRIAIIEKGRVPPTEMFKPPNVEEGVWTVWDEQGIPTTDGEGKEISKAASKKCLKEWKLQGKAHEAYLAWKQEGK